MNLSSDLEVICKDGTVKTHSLLLAGASPLLRRALSSLKLELSCGSGVVIMMDWCCKELVHKALDKLMTKDQDFKEETAEIITILKELGVNKEDGGNFAKKEVKEVNEPILTFKVEIDDPMVDDSEVDVNHKSGGDYWEGNEPELVEFEAPPPKKKRGRPPKHKTNWIENNIEIEDTFNKNNEIEVDLESQNLVKNEPILDNQELFPEHTDHDLEAQVKKMIVRNEEGAFPCQFENCDYIAGINMIYKQSGFKKCIHLFVQENQAKLESDNTLCFTCSTGLLDVLILLVTRLLLRGLQLHSITKSTQVLSTTNALTVANSYEA